MENEKMTTVVGELSYNRNDVIGKGGFGNIVYRGAFLSRPVAIKRIPRTYDDDEYVIRREVDLMIKAKNHPNILSYIHTEMNDDFLLIVTELCRGTLEEYVRGTYNGPKFKNEREILLQITQGLAHLHKENIFHRDIKPTNILIFVPDGTGTKPIIKLADFGISKMLKADKNDFTNNGTRGWMPPEAYKEERLDFKADVWALGCIFVYTLCEGKHPFGEDVDKRLDLIKTEQSMLVNRKDAKGPHKWDFQAFPLIKSMLRADPSKRPTVEDILNHPFFIPYENRREYFKLSWSSFKDFVTSYEKVQLEDNKNRGEFLKQIWSSIDSVTSDPKVQLEGILRWNETDYELKWNTTLHILCKHYKNENLIHLVTLLIEKGADVNAKNIDGEIPLHLLCFNYENDNMKDIVQLLIDNGADVNAKINLRNPLHYFCQNEFKSNQNFNRKDIFQLLIENGSDVNAMDMYQTTPLHLLFKMNNEKNNDWRDIAHLLRYVKVDPSLHPLFSRFQTEKTTKEIGELSYDPNCIIGQGGFGIVFSGFYSCPSMPVLPVAIKRISGDGNNISATQDEVELMIKAKDHPNILRYIYKEKDDNFMYIATELCKGTLQQYITGKGYNGPKFESEREILFQITRGLAHLHRLDIVHRDIKPTNILIYVKSSSDEKTDAESSPQVKLADFGRSKIVDEDFTNSNTTNPRGTRGWMAPEFYQSKKVDSKVDIFALGLIFGYTLSGGKHPFGNEPDEWVMRIKKKKPMKMAQNHLKEPFSSENDESFDLIKFMLKMSPKERPTVQNIATSPFFSANRQKLFDKICSSFEKCITAESIAQFEKLLKNDEIDGNVKSESGYTPLHISCQYCGNNNLADVIRYLVIEKRANVNAKDKYKQTPLHILCQNNKNENLIDIVKFLIEKGAEVNAKNTLGWTTLLSLCHHYKNDNLIGIVHLFLQKGGEVNTRDTDGLTPLHCLCRNYDNDNLIDIVQLLVENGVNVNEKNKYGQTPLHFLCRYYKNDNLIVISQFLIQKGAEVNAKNQEGETPLHNLCNYYKIDNAIKEEDNLKSLISLFEKHGAIMDAKDNEGTTPNDYLIRRKENPEGIRESTDRSQ